MATKIRRTVLRISADTHRRLKIEAARMMMSLTEYTDEVLKRGLQRKESNGRGKAVSEN